MSVDAPSQAAETARTHFTWNWTYLKQIIATLAKVK